MPQSSDIILIGAGRSPHTRQRRRRNGFPQRNFYIGHIQIRTGLRFPVDLEFVKRWYDEIVKRIEAGTLIVEYRLDRFVDAEELKTLAFGSDDDKAAYEKSLGSEVEQKASEQNEARENLRREQEERATLSVQGFLPAAQPDSDLIHEGEARGDELTGGADSAGLRAAIDGEEGRDYSSIDYRSEKDGMPAEQARLNTEGGSIERPLTSPSDLALAAQQKVSEENAAGVAVPDQRPEEVEAAAASVEGPSDNDNVRSGVEGGEDGATEEPAEPELSTVEAVDRSADPNFKALPDGWRSVAKPELIALCEERGIDTSDMPSNKELRRRLERYIAGT